MRDEQQRRESAAAPLASETPVVQRSHHGLAGACCRDRRGCGAGHELPARSPALRGSRRWCGHGTTSSPESEMVMRSTLRSARCLQQSVVEPVGDRCRGRTARTSHPPSTTRTLRRTSPAVTASQLPRVARSTRRHRARLPAKGWTNPRRRCRIQCRDGTATPWRAAGCAGCRSWIRTSAPKSRTRRSRAARSVAPMYVVVTTRQRCPAGLESPQFGLENTQPVPLDEGAEQVDRVRRVDLGAKLDSRVPDRRVRW